MEDMPTFPLNAWYAAAWCHEVGRQEPLARTLCNTAMVLWRNSRGTVSALEDACWHRQLPLSMGRLDGDELVCRYHGLGFGSDGQCTRMPSQDKLNPSACVRSYPVVERHRFVWVWPGDPALADPALVPDMHWNDDPEWEGDGKTMFAKCDYRLFVDNLMDLTHESFVHATSIGNKHVAEAPMKTTHEGATVTSTRWMLDIDAPPFWRAQLGKPGNVDRWQVIQFEAPCTIVLDVGVALAGTGAPEGDRSQGVNGRVLNTITPETDTTCMYFWSLLRNYRLRDQTLTTQLREANANIFLEDKVVVEAQQRVLDQNPGRGLNNLNIDAGATWARRVTNDMITKETQTD
ncbi:MAG: phenylpropionate dioxygenase-like ring-hydroxylating dioxygenase large terminal subunit [Paracoccaceae bacterium]|jgi:phenylpropionate dioxygenase-like ring-hydroxylating dioxygenase large terminal subunit